MNNSIIERNILSYLQPANLQYNDLVERLMRLDEDAALLSESEGRLHITIVGGGALILQKIIARATHDIDAISVSPTLLYLLDKYDINTRVNTYVDSFPYNFESRLRKLPITGKKIDFYAVSLEDLVIAKLHSNRDTDIQDIESDAVRKNIDWGLLEKLALSKDEALASSFSKQRHSEFLHFYHEYVRKFRPCDR